MFGDIGIPELLIILAIVVLLFGVGRIGRLGKDLGTSIKEFRRAVSDDEPQPQQANVAPTVAPMPVAAAIPAPEHVAAAAAREPASQPQAQQGPPTIF